MHLGMELRRVKVACSVGGNGKGGAGRGAQNLKTGRDLGDMIAVAHPNAFAPLKEPACQKVALGFGGFNIGPPEFGGRVFARLNPTPEVMHHHLLAVADAQDRHAQLINPGRGTG